MEAKLFFFKGGEEPYTLELYNLSGSTVIKEKLQGPEYHLPEGSIASGIYVIRITDNRGKMSSGMRIKRSDEHVQ